MARHAGTEAVQHADAEKIGRLRRSIPITSACMSAARRSMTYAHIGNARPAIVFDVLFRLLHHVYGEDHVTYARNITDVDDKINARALRDHPRPAAQRGDPRGHRKDRDAVS